jgi:hypothetical protein
MRLLSEEKVSKKKWLEFGNKATFHTKSQN